MKKITMALSLAFVFAIALPSCGGGGWEADLRSFAKKSCKAKKLMEKPETMAEGKKLAEELENDIKALEKKYPELEKDKDKAKEEKAKKIMEEEMANCK